MTRRSALDDIDALIDWLETFRPGASKRVHFHVTTKRLREMFPRGVVEERGPSGSLFHYRGRILVPADQDGSD